MLSVNQVNVNQVGELLVFRVVGISKLFQNETTSQQTIPEQHWVLMMTFHPSLERGTTSFFLTGERRPSRLEWL